MVGESKNSLRIMVCRKHQYFVVTKSQGMGLDDVSMPTKYLEVIKYVSTQSLLDTSRFLWSDDTKLILQPKQGAIKAKIYGEVRELQRILKTCQDTHTTKTLSFLYKLTHFSFFSGEKGRVVMVLFKTACEKISTIR